MAFSVFVKPDRRNRKQNKPNKLQIMKQTNTKLLSMLGSLLLAGGLLAADMMSAHVAAQSRTGRSGLPIPRFVSLKSGQANMRVGPGKEYKVSWLFVKSGYPLEIVEEYDNWRKVRDPEGVQGWVFHSLLSGRRSAIVSPWNKDNPRRKVSLNSSPDPNSSENAVMEPGVLVEVSSCENSWCHVAASSPETGSVDGYVSQDQLWGVYPDETFED